MGRPLGCIRAWRRRVRPENRRPGQAPCEKNCQDRLLTPAPYAGGICLPLGRMLLYNVTVGIDKVLEAEWLIWMRDQHIPAVMATGYFKEYKMYKVLHDQGE